MPTKVLSFHHISRRPGLSVGPDIDIRLSPEDLRACLEAHQGWELVGWRDALQYGARGPERALLLTFDDGYLDQLEEALPVLEAFEAPCILFVVPGYLDRAIRPMESDVAWIASHLEPGTQRPFYDRTHRPLRRRSPAHQARQLRSLARRHGAPYPPPMEDRFLNWDQLRELARHPLVTIGSHTMSHAVLAPLCPRRAARETADSKTRLEAMLDTPVECFAYPYGRHDRFARTQVARAGYRFAFTTEPACVGPGHDPYAIPRYGVDGPHGCGPIDGARTASKTESRRVASLATS